MKSTDRCQAGEIASIAPMGAFDDALAAARQVWPALVVDDAAFQRHLAKLVEATALAQLHVADVYLTVACAGGDGAALAALEREYFADLRATLSRMGLAASAIDETLQAMRAELLVARADAPPKILGYGGRGTLRGWLRSVAARTGLRGRRPAAGARTRHLCGP